MEQMLAKSLASAYRACLESQEPIVREMTRPEFDAIYRRITENEASLYHADPADRERFLEECMADAGRTWENRIHAYTVDGTQGLVTVRNRDGSTYIYLVYVPESDRGHGTGSMLIRKAVADSPRGISLHTDRKNDRAFRLYSRLGFSEYPSSDPSQRFMATRPDIGGNEWWEVNCKQNFS